MRFGENPTHVLTKMAFPGSGRQARRVRFRVERWLSLAIKVQYKYSSVSI